MTYFYITSNSQAAASTISGSHQTVLRGPISRPSRLPDAIAIRYDGIVVLCSKWYTDETPSGAFSTDVFRADMTTGSGEVTLAE